MAVRKVEKGKFLVNQPKSISNIAPIRYIIFSVRVFSLRNGSKSNIDLFNHKLP